MPERGGWGVDRSFSRKTGNSTEVGHDVTRDKTEKNLGIENPPKFLFRKLLSFRVFHEVAKKNSGIFEMKGNLQKVNLSIEMCKWVRVRVCVCMCV